MNLAIDILCAFFALLVIAHFILWGRLKSYVKKSHPDEWKEYKAPLFYKIMLFDRGVMNSRFAYFMQFVQGHKSLSEDTNITNRIKVLRRMHGIAAAIGIAIVLLIIILYRP